MVRSCLPAVARGLALGVLLAFFAVGFTGCEPSPAASGEALTLGAMLALTLRQMLRNGTWPKRWTVREPARTLIATGLGALAADLMAVAQGRTWTEALGATIAGLPALLQGLAEAAVPKDPSAPTTTAAIAATPVGYAPKDCSENRSSCCPPPQTSLPKEASAAPSPPRLIA